MDETRSAGEGAAFHVHVNRNLNVVLTGTVSETKNAREGAACLVHENATNAGATMTVEGMKNASEGAASHAPAEKTNAEKIVTVRLTSPATEGAVYRAEINATATAIARQAMNVNVVVVSPTRIVTGIFANTIGTVEVVVFAKMAAAISDSKRKIYSVFLLLDRKRKLAA